MVQTKRFTGLLELMQLYKQNPLEKVLIFTIYQNYTLALHIQFCADLIPTCFFFFLPFFVKP